MNKNKMLGIFYSRREIIASGQRQSLRTFVQARRDKYACMHTQIQNPQLKWKML